MLAIIVFGCVLIILTGVVHTFLSAVVVRYVHSEKTHKRSIYRAVLKVDIVVLLTITATLLEAAIWAGGYLAVGALESFEESLYFSIITFTTLGYGDIVLSEDWRLLASFEAANGVIMFGWSTSLVVLVVQNMRFKKE